jgi:hypothetical protein
MDVIGKICPYCHTIIKSDQPYVICKQCGIAHHLVCWQVKGCTTFGCSNDNQIHEDTQTESCQAFVSNSTEEKQIPIATPVIRRTGAIIVGLVFILALSLVAGWHWYESIYKYRVPEKVVKNFYEAYFDHDFNVVAQNLSVFWATRFLPDDYANMTPSQLIQGRAQIEKDIAAVIADNEKDSQIPQGVTINIMNDYTKVGKYSAVVVYSFMENGKQTSMEAAILIQEKGRFRIFNMSQIDETVLPQIKDLDITKLDQNFTDLLNGTQAQ